MMISLYLSDDELSFHEDASGMKKEYDIWAMEMEHYLEYIDNDVWKYLLRISAVEKERKARTILLMAIPKEHLRRFHGMDDAKEIWEVIRTRFGGNANSKKMQKAIFKQQFEAFTISSSEGFEKSMIAWSNLAITMRTKPDVDTLSIDDLYNNLRVFEKELTSISKLSVSAQNVAFVSHSKSSNNKVLLMRECTSKGINDGKKRDSFYQDQGARKKEQNQNSLLTIDDDVVNWGEHTIEEEDTNHALMTISSNNEKLEAQVVTFQKQQLSLNEQLTIQANEIYAKDEKLKKYRRIGMKAVKEKEQLKKIVDS
ncbi:hypothetical protein Tco_0858434 [Tanacetum coccineum]|uniref:Uncharacterized protein n=1 Tax=Tanacetum coccineum TaxID=301880 RepID=A0ABQ5BC27_9ASTR